MKEILLKQFALLVVISLITFKAYSQHVDDAHHKESSDHHSSHTSQNHIAVAIGSTTNFDHHSTDFTIGVDYEYRFKASHGLFGLGVFGEYVATSSGEVIGGVPLFFHPVKGLKLIVAPIFVMSEDHNTHKNETHFGGRLGVAYDFHIGKLSVGPLVNFDYTNITALNYGLAIGFGF